MDRRDVDLWIIVLFLSVVLTLILIAPILIASDVVLNFEKRKKGQKARDTFDNRTSVF